MGSPYCRGQESQRDPKDLCLIFPTGLNAALEMHQYPLPVPERSLHQAHLGKIFRQT